MRRRFWFSHYVRSRLHRRLFWAMGLAILCSVGIAALVVHFFLDRSRFDFHRIETFASNEFARAWPDDERRHELLQSLSSTFEVALNLRDIEGKLIDEAGGACPAPRYTLLVRASIGAQPLGRLEICSGEVSFMSRAPWPLGFLIFAGTLWLISGWIARRLGRPLGHLVEVTQAIGGGDLKSRARLGRHQPGEIGILAESINFMAGRIEKQIQDQKELLAAVSHEVRTPLTRLRVVSELLEESGANSKLTGEVAREVREIDDLVGQLLAHSRLEFHASQAKVLSAYDLGKTALERQGLPLDILDCQADMRLLGDPTLLGRALTNLLQNAQIHGQGATKLSISSEPGKFVFQVEDRGPGIPAVDHGTIFDPFVGPSLSPGASGLSSLGLGLSLVQRIARAHGGEAQANNRSDGGARVSFWIAANSLSSG